MATRSASASKLPQQPTVPPFTFRPWPHARSRLNAHTTVMLAADQPPQRADSLRSVDSAASSASLSRKPRTTKQRSRSRSAAADTRRSLSIPGDANDSMSDELFASYSSLKSRSAGHSPLNSPDFNPPPNAQFSSSFPFLDSAQPRPSSAEPTVSQPKLPHLRGRHQIPGPSKVSTNQIPHALRAFPILSLNLNQHDPAGSGVETTAQPSPSRHGFGLLQLFSRSSYPGRVFHVQTQSAPGFVTIGNIIFSIPRFDLYLVTNGPRTLSSVTLRTDAGSRRSSHASGE